MALREVPLDVLLLTGDAALVVGLLRVALLLLLFEIGNFLIDLVRLLVDLCAKRRPVQR